MMSDLILMLYKPSSSYLAEQGKLICSPDVYSFSLHRISHHPSFSSSRPVCNTPILKIHILDPFRQTVRAVEIRAASALDRAFFERFYDREQRHPPYT